MIQNILFWGHQIFRDGTQSKTSNKTTKLFKIVELMQVELC